MPDDKKPDDQKGTDAGPQPAIDADMIRGAVEGAVKDVMSQWQPPEPTPRPEPRPQPQSNNRNPLVDVIGPIVNPALHAIDVTANDAKDAAMFYVEHPEALKHKKAVEEAAETMKRQGTPLTREALWDWYKGKNFDKFRDEANKEQQKQADEAARAATVVGPGSPNREQRPGKDPHEMTDDELAKSLQGVAF